MAVNDTDVEMVVMGPGMVTRYDLHVDVEADDHPKRRVNLGDRTQEIKRKLRMLIDQIHHPKSPGSHPKCRLRVRLYPEESMDI